MKKIKNILFVLITILICSNQIKAQNYDYLIITPDIFTQSATWPNVIINLQTSRGLHPKIVTVSLSTTAANIKSIIQTYYNSNPLKYVLLMGNGKNIVTQGQYNEGGVDYMYADHGTIVPYVDYQSETYIPFFSVLSNNPWNPAGSNIATDDPYVAGLTSHGSVYIGRVPIISISEANQYVNKLSTYYNSLKTYSSALNKEILLNIDMDVQSYYCTAALVNEINNTLKAEHIPSTTSITDLKVSQYLGTCDPLHPYNYCATRATTFESNLNQGASIISILGTSGGPFSFGGWYWPEANYNLTNLNTAMPFVIAPNCMQGEVNSPDYESTMRKLMVFYNGGIIGAMAPTQGSEQHENGYILNRFNDLIFQNQTMSYGEIFKTIKDEMFANFSVMEFFNNGFTYFGDPSLVPSICKHKSGTISSSETWSGNIVVDNTITVSSGKTLTILPGTNIFFNSSASLLVYGKLIANGNTTQPILFTSKSGSVANSWGSIELNGSGASGSNISHANIKYGNEVRVINVPSFEISFCDFTNNYISIYAAGSDGIIHNNNLTSNSIGHSIDIENHSGIDCYVNTIIKTSPYQKRGIGILYSGGSDGNAYKNDINYCDWGIGAIWSSYLSSWASSEPNNRIRNCNVGINIYRSSYADFGFPSAPECEKNSIYNNSMNATVGNMYTTYVSGLYALYNWWGTYPPNTNKFSCGPGSYLYYDNSLNYDPWASSQKTLTNNDELITSQKNEEIPVTVPIDPNSIFDGILLKNKGDYKLAKEFFITYLGKHPEDQAAYVELYTCYNNDNADDIIKYFSSLPKKASKDYKLLLSHLYLKQNNIEKARKINDEIINENSNTSLAAMANVNNMFIALYFEDNIDKANTIFNIVSKNSESLLPSEISDMQYEIKTYEEVHSKSIPGSSFNKAASNNIIETPKEYSLLGNYPNPFNPTTTIAYNLPRTSDVELKIYDILGNEVKSFFIQSQSAGTQNIVWNGTNNYYEQIASGIYIYRFKAVSREGKNEVFVKSAKLIMLK